MLPSQSHHSLRSENLRYEADAAKPNPEEKREGSPAPALSRPAKARITPFVTLPGLDEMPSLGRGSDTGHQEEEEEEEREEPEARMYGFRLYKIKPSKNCAKKARCKTQDE